MAQVGASWLWGILSNWQSRWWDGTWGQGWRKQAGGRVDDGVPCGATWAPADPGAFADDPLPRRPRLPCAQMAAHAKEKLHCVEQEKRQLESRRGCPALGFF